MSWFGWLKLTNHKSLAVWVDRRRRCCTWVRPGAKTVNFIFVSHDHARLTFFRLSPAFLLRSSCAQLAPLWVKSLIHENFARLRIFILFFPVRFSSVKNDALSIIYKHFLPLCHEASSRGFRFLIFITSCSVEWVLASQLCANDWQNLRVLFKLAGRCQFEYLFLFRFCLCTRFCRTFRNNPGTEVKLILIIFSCQYQ